MTLDEAIEELGMLFVPRDGEQDRLADAQEMAIRSLEAWEKVKADIKEHTKRYSLSSEQNYLGTVLWSKYMISFDDVIAIIEKHLQEVTTDADCD